MSKRETVLFPMDGILCIATASLVLRLVANSTILMEASPLKDLGASERPRILLMAEDVIVDYKVFVQHIK